MLIVVLMIVGKLRGLNESLGELEILFNLVIEDKVCFKVKEVVVVICIGFKYFFDGDFIYRFVGRIIFGGIFVFVTVNIKVKGKDCFIIVNCEKMVISFMFVKEIK